MIQQKLSLFQSLNSSPSRAVGMEEVERLIHYDNDVRYKTESYRKMASVLGKEKADEEVKRRLVPACSIGVLFDGNGRGAANVLGFTGLALVDIDHVVSEEFFAKQSGKAERRVKSEEFVAATPSADGIPVGNSSFFPLHSSLSMALDLCAAPGGKSTLLRALLPDEALLYSNEPVRQRASILSENIQKWGHRGSIVTNNYPQDYVRSGLMFDLILCDVPCSGEGMFRRDPQTIGEWSATSSARHGSACAPAECLYIVPVHLI